MRAGRESWVRAGTEAWGNAHVRRVEARRARSSKEEQGVMAVVESSQGPGYWTYHCHGLRFDQAMALLKVAPGMRSEVKEEIG